MRSVVFLFTFCGMNKKIFIPVFFSLAAYISAAEPLCLSPVEASGISAETQASIPSLFKNYVDSQGSYQIVAEGCQKTASINVSKLGQATMVSAKIQDSENKPVWNHQVKILKEENMDKALAKLAEVMSSENQAAAPAVEPAAESVAKAEPAAEPVAEPVAEPTPKPAAEPVAATPAPTPVAKAPAKQPAAQPVAAPAPAVYEAAPAAEPAPAKKPRIPNLYFGVGLGLTKFIGDEINAFTDYEPLTSYDFFFAYDSKYTITMLTLNISHKVNTVDRNNKVNNGDYYYYNYDKYEDITTDYIAWGFSFYYPILSGPIAPYIGVGMSATTFDIDYEYNSDEIRDNGLQAHIGGGILLNRNRRLNTWIHGEYFFNTYEPINHTFHGFSLLMRVSLGV